MRRAPGSTEWRYPGEVFKCSTDLSGSGWAEEVDEKVAEEFLFSPKVKEEIEQTDEEPTEAEPIEEVEEPKQKRKYKK